MAPALSTPRRCATHHPLLQHLLLRWAPTKQTLAQEVLKTSPIVRNLQVGEVFDDSLIYWFIFWVEFICVKLIWEMLPECHYLVTPFLPPSHWKNANTVCCQICHGTTSNLIQFHGRSTWSVDSFTWQQVTSGNPLWVSSIRLFQRTTECGTWNKLLEVWPQHDIHSRKSNNWATSKPVDDQVSPETSETQVPWPNRWPAHRSSWNSICHFFCSYLPEQRKTR